MRRLSQCISLRVSRSREDELIPCISDLITHAARVTLSASRDRCGHNAQRAAPPRDVSRPGPPRARRGARGAPGTEAAAARIARARARGLLSRIAVTK
jgi:hypothetical protein